MEQFVVGISMFSWRLQSLLWHSGMRHVSNLGKDEETDKSRVGNIRSSPAIGPGCGTCVNQRKLWLWQPYGLPWQGDDGGIIAGK